MRARIGVLHLDIFGVALVVLQGLLQQRHRQHDDQRKDVGVGVDGAAAGGLGFVQLDFVIVSEDIW